MAAVLAGACALVSYAAPPPPTAVPLWAYGFVTPASPGEKAMMPGPPTHALRPGENPAEQRTLRRIEGARGEYSLLQIRDGNEVVDWYPGDHPELTQIMRHGPARLREKGFGCAFCHMPNGKGRPENAPVAGLSVSYFVRQIQDMREGLRASAEPRKGNTILMVALAQAMTDSEIRESAEYFAAVPYTPWIRVVETDRVPRSKIVTNMFVPIESELTEPIAGRVMEMPENAEATELLRHPHAGFVAYVPPGSVRKGEQLVSTGKPLVVDGKPAKNMTTACASCHGADLLGVGEIPPIAGRSPSYIVRQLYDIQQGTRKSQQSLLMLPVVADLTNDDFVAIAAYVSSLSPVKAATVK